MQPAAEKLLQRYEDFLEYANLFAIFSYGVPKELCSNGESRGLGRPLIKWSGISHCDPSAECEVPLFPCGMHSLLWSRSFGAKRK